MAKILVFGDSIFAGWDGKERVAKPVPDQIGAVLGATVVNMAVDGTRINSGGQSLEQLAGSIDMAGYDLILLGYGTNDWGYQDETLNDMRQGLDFFKQKLQSENPSAKVFYELPMEQFGLGSTSLDDKNGKGLSQNDVANFLKQYAISNNWGYYDWRSNPIITYANRMQTTGDNGWGHPTPASMQLMVQRLVPAIKPYLGNVSPSNPTTPDNPSTPSEPDDGSILSKMAKYKYIYFGFDPKDENAQQPYAATAAMCGSNDALHYDLIGEFPQLGNFRDGSLMKYGNHYWITGSGLYRTDDFKTFTKYDSSAIFGNSGYKDIWAPDFFTDLAGNWHIAFCAIKVSGDGLRHSYIADFNPDTGAITNSYQAVSCDSGIDPHIITIGSTYYLFIDGYWLYQSNSYLGPYTEVKTNIQHPGLDWTKTSNGWKTSGNNWYEAAATIITDNKIYLYMDLIDHHIAGVTSSGHMVVQSANLSDLPSWSGPQAVISSVNMRHGSFIKMSGASPTTPDVDSITLQNVSDYTQISNVTKSNYSISFGGINSIYMKLSRLIGDDYSSIKTTFTSTSSMLNRATWLFVVHVVEQVEQEVNEAVSIFRANDLVDIKTGNQVEYLDLDPPTRLLLDNTYQQTLNSDWTAVQNKINEMLAILKQFHL